MQSVLVAGEVLLDLTRMSGAGMLRFSVFNDGRLAFWEGDRVELFLGDWLMFHGFVFAKSRTRNEVIDVLCYDQLRYLQNRDSYRFQGLTASGIIRRMLQDTGLSVGYLQGTGFVLPERIEQERSLLDIAQTAIDTTAAFTGQLFVLRDVRGRVELRNVRDLAVDTVIHRGNMRMFDYRTDIDRTFTAVRLYQPDEDGGDGDYVHARSVPGMQRWGFLQKYVRGTGDVDGQSEADALLRWHNRKMRHLRVLDAVGNLSVRGGSLLPVDLDLGDMMVKEFLMVESVRHKFTENGHLMDLILVGGEIVD